MNKIYWIEAQSLPTASGRLAIVARPRGNDWLLEDLQSLHHAGINVLVSFLESFEQLELGLAAEETAARDLGIEYKNYPITDRETPESLFETQRFIRQLTTLLFEGKNIGVHCRQSVGRAGFISAAILVENGYSINEAFQAVEAARGCSVPDTEEQRQWVEKYAKMKEFAFQINL